MIIVIIIGAIFGDASIWPVHELWYARKGRLCKVSHRCWRWWLALPIRSVVPTSRCFRFRKRILPCRRERSAFRQRSARICQPKFPIFGTSIFSPICARSLPWDGSMTGKNWYPIRFRWKSTYIFFFLFFFQITYSFAINLLLLTLRVVFIIAFGFVVSQVESYFIIFYIATFETLNIIHIARFFLLTKYKWFWDLILKRIIAVVWLVIVFFARDILTTCNTPKAVFARESNCANY